MFTKLLVSTALAITVVTSAFASTKDIVDTATGDAKLKTLVTAIKEAGLVETLKGAGPFTVFAPTDAAFEKLPKKELEDLLKPENKAKLTKILTFHVVSGEVMSKDLKGKKLDTSKNAFSDRPL